MFHSSDSNRTRLLNVVSDRQHRSCSRAHDWNPHRRDFCSINYLNLVSHRTKDLFYRFVLKFLISSRDDWKLFDPARFLFGIGILLLWRDTSNTCDLKNVAAAVYDSDDTSSTTVCKDLISKLFTNSLGETPLCKFLFQHWIDTIHRLSMWVSLTRSPVSIQHCLDSKQTILISRLIL